MNGKKMQSRNWKNVCRLSKTKPKLKAEFSEPPQTPSWILHAYGMFKGLWPLFFSGGCIFSGFLENLQSHAWL